MARNKRPRSTYVQQRQQDGTPIKDLVGVPDAASLGPMGSPGQPGEEGPEGPQGPPGNSGPAGPPGAPGVSNIPGPAGPIGGYGEDGVDGADGAPGPMGPTGATGAKLLVHQASGTDSRAGGGTLDSYLFAAGDLTPADSVEVIAAVVAQAQPVHTFDLQNVTDGVRFTSTARGYNGGPFDLAAGGSNVARSLVVRAPASGLVVGHVWHSTKGGAAQFGDIAVVTDWSASWAIGITFDGIPAGGTFVWEWKVYIVKGEGLYAAGAPGPTGAQGQIGPQGPPGWEGPEGDAGEQGVQGPIGPTGNTGAAGAQGLQGLAVPGQMGDEGAEGEAGPPGATGLQGPIGLTGAIGPQGPQGPPGADGEEGPEGPRGATGERGATGAAGAGATGFTHFTQDLGAAKSAGTFDLTGLAGLTAGKLVLIMQTAEPIATKGNSRDEFEMDPIVLTGYVVDATTIRVYWATASGAPAVGIYAFAYQVTA